MTIRYKDSFFCTGEYYAWFTLPIPTVTSASENLVSLALIDIDISTEGDVTLSQQALCEHSTCTYINGVFTLGRTGNETVTGTGTRTIGLGPYPSSGVMWRLPHSFIKPIHFQFLSRSRFWLMWIHCHFGIDVGTAKCEQTFSGHLHCMVLLPVFLVFPSKMHSLPDMN